MKLQVKTHNGAQHILYLCCPYPKTTNTESGEPGLNNGGGKFQYKNELIIHNIIINEIWNQIYDMIQVLPPFSKTVIRYHLDLFKSSLFLGRKNITVPVKNSIRWYGWLTDGGKRWKNSSITCFNDNVDKIILDAEVNACGIMDLPSIEKNFDNEHIHALHDLTKQ